MSDHRSGRHISISSLVSKPDAVVGSETQSPAFVTKPMIKSPPLQSILNPMPEQTPPKLKVMTLSQLMNAESGVTNPISTPALELPVTATPISTPLVETEKTRKPPKTSPTKEPEKINLPAIINIEIPLSTHNDIHSEQIFSKLVEEKYGPDAQPTTINKALWNDDADDNDNENENEDDEEDGDDEAILEPETMNTSITNQTVYDDEDEIVKSLKIKFAPGLSDVEKEKIVLDEIHRRKMENNKRIGKYDVDDPFIDDEELVYEEDTNANADGWFIWHGDLEVTKKTIKKIEPVEIKSVKLVKSGRSTNHSNSIATGSSTGQTGDKRKFKDTSKPTPPAPAAKKQKPTEPIKDTKKAEPVTKPADKEIAKPDNKPESSGDKPPALIIGSFGF